TGPRRSSLGSVRRSPQRRPHEQTQASAQAHPRLAEPPRARHAEPPHRPEDHAQRRRLRGTDRPAERRPLCARQGGGGGDGGMSLPAPYYDDPKAGITIYHGDCREILPLLGRFDLLLTDPPYGINLDTSARWP